MLAFAQNFDDKCDLTKSVIIHCDFYDDEEREEATAKLLPFIRSPESVVLVILDSCEDELPDAAILMRKNNNISHDTFREILETLSKNEDEEIRHKIADALLCEVLKQNGYGEGIEIFESMGKYYI